MKIPTTTSGNVPYYHGTPNGMDMNQQWQGNGVMMEGGPQGNGSAYMMPHHMHPAGFVPPGGYFGGPHQPSQPQDFSEYMWMENEEEFDKQVMQQLEEEALMEQCIEAMLADEREAQSRGDVSLEEQVSKSTLNPLAAEFVPTFLPSSASEAEGSTVSVASENPPKDDGETLPESLSQLSLSKPEAESGAVAVAEIPTGEEAAKDVDKTPDVTAKKPEAKKKPEEKKKPEVKKDKDAGKRAKVKDAKPSDVKDAKPSEVKDAKSCEAREVKSTEAKDAKPTEAKDAKPSEAKDVKSSEAKDAKPAEVVEAKSTEAKSVEEVVVDLHGPPLPSLQTSVPVETAQVSTPAVFNYAAAARANLPARPAAPRAEAAPPAAAAAAKPKTPAPKDDKKPFRSAATSKKGKK